MRRMWLLFLLALCFVGLALACGGGSNSTSGGTSGPVTATKLVYTAPTGSGWRFMQEPSSTPTKLVLGLYAPSNGRAVAFTVQVDPAFNHTVENTFTGSYRTYLSGDLVGIFSGNGAPLPNGPLATVTIWLPPGTAPRAVPFTVSLAQGVSSGPVSPVTVEVGVIQATQ